MARTSTIPRLKDLTEEDEEAAQELEKARRRHLFGASNVFELDPAAARAGREDLASRRDALLSQEQKQSEFRRASAGRQTTPGQPLPGTLVPGPGNEIWLKRSGPGLFIEKLSNLSPKDQMRYKQLMQDRSDIAQTADLSASDRQLALDTKDAQISAIPKQPPILREPSAQKQFEDRIIIDPNGRQGYAKSNGDLAYFDEGEKADKLKRKQTIADGLSKLYFEEWDEFMDPVELNDHAEAQLRLEYGEPQDTSPDTRFIPELEPLWQGTVSDLENLGGKVTEQNMLDMMPLYVWDAGRRNPPVPPVEARLDFLQHWKSELGGGRFRSIIPKMSEATERLFRTAGSDTVTGPNDPWAGQEETGQQQGPALPTTQAEYDALPSGTRYTDPRGNTGVKP